MFLSPLTLAFSFLHFLCTYSLYCFNTTSCIYFSYVTSHGDCHPHSGDTSGSSRSSTSTRLITSSALLTCYFRSSSLVPSSPVSQSLPCLSLRQRHGTVSFRSPASIRYSSGSLRHDVHQCHRGDVTRRYHHYTYTWSCPKETELKHILHAELWWQQKQRNVPVNSQLPQMDRHYQLRRNGRQSRQAARLRSAYDQC